MVHLLKTNKALFVDVASNNKSFKLRRDDRRFIVGDVLWLAEYDEVVGEFTGRSVYRRVTYVLRPEVNQDWGLRDGYCCMSISEMSGPVYLCDMNNAEAREEVLGQLNKFYS